MNKRRFCFCCGFICLLIQVFAHAQDAGTVVGTEPLTWQGDLSEMMVAGIDRYLSRALAESVGKREKFWQRDFASAEAYSASVEGNREDFRRIIGLVDKRVSANLEIFGDYPGVSTVAEAGVFTISQVRWESVAGVWSEGLLLQPKGKPLARIVAIPDADQTPEQLSGLAPGIKPASQFARTLAANGFLVLVPTLIDRSSEFSGNPELGETQGMTNMPHREWLYRMAYEMGRHLIGYEVQKVLAAVDWFKEQDPSTPIGLVGYGEGGLIAFYAAAADQRISACLVSGYFQPRESVWEEPIYRNVWSLLQEFGDAEIAGLIIPRGLVIENSQMPRVEGPRPAEEGRRNAAAPGRIETPPAERIFSEFERARTLSAKLPETARGTIQLIPAKGPLDRGEFGSEDALQAFLGALVPGATPQISIQSQSLRDLRAGFDPRERQRRLVSQIQDHVQHLLKVSHRVRDQRFLDRMPMSSARDFEDAARKYRQQFWEEVIGKVDDPLLPPAARSRRVYDRPGWTGYDVVLDVWPDVFSWGVLLLPKDLKPGERRPVVVAQHGLEGLPRDVIENGVDSFGAYQAFAARLADEGFIVFAPHNPYRGQEKFRKLQFMANPLKLSLFSFIVGQHQQLLRWLKSLPYVDPDHIGFYGLSYGGKTAMRVPAILEDYNLSICSGDFNEWIWKNVTVDWQNSYMYTREYEMYEFDLGMTYNYAEMAYLMFPRPFMVERGHRDGVGLDEWVTHEYAKVRRLYDELGHGDRTRIEFFNGVHEIHGVGTFEFLHRFLDWPGR